jgi:hypothetical protein
MPAYNFRIHKLYSRQTGFKIYHQIHRFWVWDNLLYAISGIVILLWVIGFWGMNVNSGIHILLIFAANLILLNIIQNQNSKE